MKETSKKPFFDENNTLKQILPLIISFVLFIVVILIPMDANRKGGAIMLIVIFGGIISFSAIAKGSSSDRNVNYLRELKLFEQMCLETPESFGNNDDYVFTDTFVFFRDRNVCLPIANISRVKPVIVNYINNAAKSKAEVWLTTDKGEDYCVFLWLGSFSEDRNKKLTNFIVTLKDRNPKVVVKK